MKARWQHMMNHWEQFAPREKLALIGGGVLLAILFIYLAIWRPSHAAINHMRQQIIQDQKTFALMSALDTRIKEVEKKNHGTRNKTTTITLLSELQKQITQNHLDKALTELKQISSDAIELHFKHVDFDKLIALLTHVTRTYRISITQFSAEAQTEKGIVNVDMVIMTA